MSVPRTLSSTGCRTRDDAVERMRLWLHDVQADAIRALETSLICACDADADGDLDCVDESLDFIRANYAETLEETLRDFRAFMDEHNIGPACSPTHRPRLRVNLGACDLEDRACSSSPL